MKMSTRSSLAISQRRPIMESYHYTCKLSMATWEKVESPEIIKIVTYVIVLRVQITGRAVSDVVLVLVDVLDFSIRKNFEGREVFCI